MGEPLVRTRGIKADPERRDLASRGISLKGIMAVLKDIEKEKPGITLEEAIGLISLRQQESAERTKTKNA